MDVVGVVESSHLLNGAEHVPQVERGCPAVLDQVRADLPRVRLHIRVVDSRLELHLGSAKMGTYSTC